MFMNLKYVCKFQTIFTNLKNIHEFKNLKRKTNIKTNMRKKKKKKERLEKKNEWNRPKSKGLSYIAGPIEPMGSAFARHLYNIRGI